MPNCKNCTKPLVVCQQKFCGSSCSATFNNTKRVRSPWTIEAKKKYSLKMKQLYKDGKNSHISELYPPQFISKNPHSRIFKWVNCNSCQQNFWQRKWGQKCCSVECRDSIRSQNKCIKTQISYFNHNENRTVNLQSSWEKNIAEWLDSEGIKWLRPSKRIHWFDTTMQKNRTYLPDFYLPTFNKFLDVKNPIKMIEDDDKLNQLIKLLPLIVGDKEYIKTSVKNLGAPSRI